jgi:uncharacterized membrane protein YccC
LSLEALMQHWHGCVLLRRRVDRGLAEGGTPRLAPSSLRGEAFHRDAGLAALSAFTAAVFLCCVFWLATAWPAGSDAASFAAIMCSLFATRDDPVPAIHDFLKYTLGPELRHALDPGEPRFSSVATADTPRRRTRNLP